MASLLFQALLLCSAMLLQTAHSKITEQKAPPVENFSELKPCTQTNRGTWCIYSLQNYPLPVAILIPKKITESANPTLDLAIFLHGLNPNNNSLPEILSSLQLPDLLLNTLPDKISIVPLAFKRDQPPYYMYEFHQYFKQEASILSVVDELLRLRNLQKHAIGKISLITHSGNYRIAAAWIQSSLFKEKLQEIVLIDSIYGEHEAFAAWAKLASSSAGLAKKLRIAVSYHLYEKAQNLEALLSSLQVPYLKASADQKPPIPPEQMRASPVTLNYSKQDHFIIVPETLQIFKNP